MPWQERSAMDQRESFVADYLTEMWTMTELCGCYGISGKTGYKWVGRYRGGGASALADRSRRPHGHPDTTPAPIVRRLVAARLRFPRWSAGKLVQWLRTRYPRTAWPGRTCAYAVLAREGIPRAPRRPGPRRGPRPVRAGALTIPTAPNHVWTTDFKGEFRLGDATMCHPLTLRDGFSRFVLCCDALVAEAYPYARRAFERAFAAYGLPDCIRSDNGRPFATTGLAGVSRLSAWWMRLGIRVERIAPGHPEQNGSHEQFHRVLKQDTTRPPAPTRAVQQQRFDSFRHEYNQERPHDALGGATPVRFYARSPRRLPARLPPIDYPSSWDVRGADSQGVITFRGRKINVTRALANEDLGLEEVDDAIWRVWYMVTPLGHFDERRWRWVNTGNSLD